MRYDICCIGHITLDKVVTSHGEKFMAGGTSFYFSNAISQMDLKYILVTAIAETEIHYVKDLERKGIEVKVLPSEHTVFFENIYDEDQDHRTQRVRQQADPFSPDQLLDVDAEIFHLGPLVSGDIPVDVIKELAKRGKVSLDIQGYLREVKDEKVHHIDWAAKREALAHVAILKVNDDEMKVITGANDIEAGAKMLADWGVKEVVITLGSKGSVIYADGVFYTIPVYKPAVITDATGCGDTYMAGYLYKRVKGADIQRAGEFASAMAGLKIQSSGPFEGTEDEVLTFLKK
ncbi:PfkB family carbohydrate kinase [Mucilaginibacter agri]|uniref:Ribokinase n=1 Tax=Mucilaginibacter agri TaxID=2695265 RepID=A0A965ZES8_9SPHI|nr:PfkB family carbohydrate kinase [Mucilaginibacter agri]NCD69555.1 ribokinase [Mucilaginibacter agri]